MTPDTTSVSTTTDTPSDCDARTHRACTESMMTKALLNGKYQVDSQSGRTYYVDPIAGTCPCPDPHDRCKHLRRMQLEIAFDELPHPDECPSDTELAAREPARAPSLPQPSPPATAVADGGQAVASMSDNATEPAATAICRAISDRIRDLEREIDCYQAELHDLQTALSVIEDIIDHSGHPEPPPATTALPETSATGNHS